MYSVHIELDFTHQWFARTLHSVPRYSPLFRQTASARKTKEILIREFSSSISVIKFSDRKKIERDIVISHTYTDIPITFQYICIVRMWEVERLHNILRIRLIHREIHMCMYIDVSRSSNDRSKPLSKCRTHKPICR